MKYQPRLLKNVPHKYFYISTRRTTTAVVALCPYMRTGVFREVGQQVEVYFRNVAGGGVMG